MIVKNPFGYAAGVVGVSVPGLPSLDSSLGHKFPLETNAPLDTVWSSLEMRIGERYPYNDNESVFYLSLDEGNVAVSLYFLIIMLNYLHSLEFTVITHRIIYFRI